jgi:hypothetical protein
VGLTPPTVVSDGPLTNTPAPIVGHNTEVCMDPRPCVLKVEAILQASCNGRIHLLAIGTAALLTSAVKLDGVGHRKFETRSSEDRFQFTEVPSVMEVMPSWAAFRLYHALFAT